ncbi:MAG TPA: peptidylprolyl isomerase [Luteibaculaceae bacterium]|nr:peptidylprolyl isomerase [Luteibaculaceae bacterium]
MKSFVLSAIASMLVVFSIAQPNPQVIDGIVAVIGNEIILESDIRSQISSLKEQYRISNPDKCEILENLLMDKLMLHQARLDSVEVKEAQIQSELDRRFRYFISQLGSEQKMEEFYGKSIVELKDEFHDQLRDQMMVQQVQATITEDINVTPADVERFFKEIPVDSLPLIGSQVEVSQIVRYPEDNAAETTRIIERLEKFKKEVKEGKDFAVLASLYSEDPGSAINGGDLGMQEKGTFVPEFDAVAFSLNDGEVSKVFKTQFGYHLMQMIERRGEKYNARHILLKPKVRTEDLQLAKQKLDSIRNLIEIDSLSFEKAAVRFSMDEDTKNNGGILVNQQSGSPRFDMSDLDPQITFTINKLEVGEISEPVLLTDANGRQGYRIIRINTRTQPHRANLREDYSVIQEAASSGLRQQALEQWVSKRITSTFVRLQDEWGTCPLKYNWKK